MHFAFRKRPVLAAIAVAFIPTACSGSSHARSGADAVGTLKDTVSPHKHHTRLAGFFPAWQQACSATTWWAKSKAAATYRAGTWSAAVDA
jgi:hypothetical protein